MSWFKGDDGLPQHSKFVDLRTRRYGKAAIGDWLLGACWCAGQLTDGFLPKHIAKAYDIRPTSIRNLIEVGLWDEVEGGYQFHDWLDYNPSKQEVITRQTADAKRKAKGRVSRRDSGRPGPARPGPSRPPVPTTSETPLSESTQGPSRSLAFEAREFAAEWFFDRGDAMPMITGKALDALAERSAEIAKAFSLELREAVRLICDGADAIDNKQPFAFRLREAKVRKPKVEYVPAPEPAPEPQREPTPEELAASQEWFRQMGVGVKP